jgi:hypothetical protein
MKCFEGVEFDVMSIPKIKFRKVFSSEDGCILGQTIKNPPKTNLLFISLLAIIAHFYLFNILP